MRRPALLPALALTALTACAPIEGTSTPQGAPSAVSPGEMTLKDDPPLQMVWISKKRPSLIVHEDGQISRCLDWSHDDCIQMAPSK